MEKQEIINSIKLKLSEIGVFTQPSAETDIIVQTELLNAALGAGKRKIEYQALAFLNEAKRTLYFWEYTKEISSGFSFGSNSRTSSQSGATTFRKVKILCYDPDGQEYEYCFDLGAITKIFKQTAKKQGWKFRVVLNKKKALYPLIR